MTEILSRAEALAQGRSHYFTGAPCAQGHVAVRETKWRKCAECNRLNSAEHRRTQPDKVRTVNAKNYRKNEEVRKAAQREWNTKNAAYAIEYSREYRSANPEKGREWRQRNRALVVHYVRERQIAKQLRIPRWADLPALRAFYDRCPDGYTVDHIIPLRGKLVSGLHVANNLQYLTRAENSRKGNRFDPWTFDPNIC